MNPISKLLALVFAAALVTVGLGTGAYLALRDNGAAAPQAATAEALPDTGASPAVSDVVTETEAEVEAAEATPALPAVAPATPRVEPRQAPAPARPRASAPSRPASQTRSAGTAVPRPEPPGAAEPAAWPESRPTVTEPLEARPVEPASREVFGRQTEVSPAPEPTPQFEEVVVPAEAVIGLQIENTVTTETAAVEDPVEARVTRDVRAGGLVAIPAGARVRGSVTLVEVGGKVKERARLGVRFHTLVLADGTRVPIQSETVFREGDSPAGESAAKIGGAAIGGAILGAILGGGRGAAIGGSVGAAGGTAAVMAGGRNAATLPAGSTVTVRLTTPVTVEVEK